MAANTPNLVYYQSYTGWKLGWKILVVNEGESATAGTSGHNAGQLGLQVAAVAVLSLSAALGRQGLLE